jgi:hypothetical protein
MHKRRVLCVLCALCALSVWRLNTLDNPKALHAVDGIEARRVSQRRSRWRSFAYQTFSTCDLRLNILITECVFSRGFEVSVESSAFALHVVARS